MTEWATKQPDVLAVAVVGSYAYDHPRMASDVDMMLITTDRPRRIQGLDWIAAFDPRAKLIRTKDWGPWLTERRVRLRSGLQVELGVAEPEWVHRASARVLGDGCRVLHDPAGVLARALADLGQRAPGPTVTPDSA
ncbi:hypothetical protein [Actinopolymorpha sp. B9G3]|uniref:hypothetical protein n=1 Tax=Actinopolymorpha sp. B9G3 TaxID=3158970 RepID=UPI0032D97890